MDREKLITEAVSQMEYLGLSKACIEDFKKGKVWQSEYCGFLYTVNDEVQKQIDELEEKYSGLIYHVIVCQMILGDEKMTLYNFLWLTNEEGCWKYNHKDAKSGIVFAYVYNKDAPEYSEFGSICVRPEIGGLVRISQLFDYESFNRGKKNA